MSEERIHTYTAPGIVVFFEPKLCTHVAECIQGLPQVFNTRDKPWVHPEQAGADPIAEVIERCPTSALRYERTDGAPQEAIPKRNTVSVCPKGPLFFRGDLILTDALGNEVRRETRLALCRCGATRNPPFCDGRHFWQTFSDQGRVPGQALRQRTGAMPGALTITPLHNGPIQLKGPFELIDAKGVVRYREDGALLCRCGGSNNKPFCDFTHQWNGFQAP
ncbi:MAG: hypothetical protein COX57_08440 [Alphaproteobacteria bacterium CG_4_10_14_0_2_um_filter_63_37]|nr:MAG: hypothetical protein AUJ55_07495 [Proteobacteria bacterium CG1_02_64_396]PJA24477.1 MAG: hypothetical protein COX57_08440 [Alphaproteobacteria bacterium CG_4_10_14_0_2_um_filter_63_37]